MRDFNDFSDFGRPRIPLFFKLWFGFVALLALSILAGMIYVVVTVGSDPAILGRMVGEIVSGFREASP